VKKSVGTYKTILTITIGFLVLYLFTQKVWCLYIAISVGGLGALSSFLAQKIAYLWMKLGYLLSLVVPKILLSAIFFVLLFPLALVSRWISKKDPLHLKNNQDTVFQEVDKTFAVDSFKKPW